MRVRQVKCIRSGALVCVFLVVAGCAPAFEEVKRVGSQDRLVDAVVFNRLTDATVATPTEIYVLPAGSGPSGDSVWRADKVVGLAVTWTSTSTLQIEAKEARVFVKRDLAEVDIGGGSDKRKVTVSYRVERSL
jgi:hypothetical protein